jgi:O-antigen biosynthesis protein WbqP
MKYYFVIKRIIDFILSSVALFVLIPVFLLLAIVIKVDSKGPVFFKQKRIGKNKKQFNILKFRTMKTDAPKDIPTHLLLDPNVFITKVGKFLRKTSLDELPQILNILKGDMSIIGPRPALWNQYDLIAERDKYGANNIYPGLTGWAQVNGRDELSIDVKSKFDGEYVERMSFNFDLKVLLKTILSVSNSNGIKEGAIGDGRKINHTLHKES